MIPTVTSLLDPEDRLAFLRRKLADGATLGDRARADLTAANARCLDALASLLAGPKADGVTFAPTIVAADGSERTAEAVRAAYPRWIAAMRQAERDAAEIRIPMRTADDLGHYPEGPEPQR